MRDLLNQIDTLSEAGETAPNSIVPTHFHKSNIGTSLPLMMTEPGIFWWETSSSEGERGGGGRSIQRWQGNTESRSKWNPASVDGVYVDGKPVEFPEGVTWKTYKPEAVAKPPEAVNPPVVAKPPEAVAKPPEAVAKPPEEVKQSTKLANTPASNSDHTAKLNALSLQLQDKLNAKKISNPANSLEPTPGSSVMKPPPADTTDVGRTPGAAHDGQGSTTPATGKLNPDAKCKMCGNAYKNHFNFEPEGDPNGKVTSTKFRHPASPTDDFFPGLNGTQSTKPEPTDTVLKKADGTPAADPVGGRPPPGVIFNEPKASDELYTIQKGDNLTRLAKKFGTTVPELLKLNPDIKNPNLIIAGKDLKIPSGNPVQEGSMATALIESFGYDVELDEYSLNQFGTDVGAGARGIGNGLTFGYGDNLLARAKA